MSNPSTEVATTDLTALRRAISGGQISIAEVMEKLAAPYTPPAPDQIEAPKAIVLSAADKTILRTLPSKLADVELPVEGQPWTEEQREVLVPLFAQIKKASSALKKAEEVIKRSAHEHFDATTDGEVGKSGHKLTKGEIRGADGYGEKIIRYTIGGNAQELTDFDLEQLRDEKKISNAAYLRMTKEKKTRVVVFDAVMAEFARDPEVLSAVASVAKRSDQTVGIKMAKA